MSDQEMSALNVTTPPTAEDAKPMNWKPAQSATKIKSFSPEDA
jgi:hypothetical protein